MVVWKLKLRDKPLKLASILSKLHPAYTDRKVLLKICYLCLFVSS